MGKLYFDGKGIIKYKGEPVTELLYEGGEVMLEFTPFAGVDKAVPYAVSLNFDPEEPIILPPTVTAIRWQEDYEIRFNPLIVEGYRPPEAIKQDSVYAPEGEFTVTVYKDTRTRIAVEAPGIYKVHTPLKDINAPDIRLNQYGGKVVCAVTGQTETEQYLLILMISDRMEVLYEDYAENIIFSQNNIKLTKELKDMRGRKMTQTLAYNGAKYIEQSRVYECAYDNTFKPRLLPYALLEAIMAGDIEDARKFLDKNLQAEALREFFGEIKEICEPKYSDWGDDTLAVITKNDNLMEAAVYKFEIENNLVTNIIELTP